MSYIIDANALLNLTKMVGVDAVEILEGELTVSLSFYEVGNAIWKECNLLDELNTEKASKILDFVSSMLKHMRVISLRKSGLAEETLRTALQKDITYYDSAYLTVAEKQGRTLVTDDKKLRKIAVGIPVDTVTSGQMLEELS